MKELSEKYWELSEKYWELPDGSVRQFAWGTIEEWLYLLPARRLECAGAA
jgi:hypothetical protein